MKHFKQKTINSFAVIFMAIVFSSCSSESGPLLGSWQEYNESTDEYIIMTFDKSNYVYVDTDGEIIGGKNFSGGVEDGVETFMSLTYEVDYSKEPHWIDVVMHILDVKPAKGTDKFTSEQKKYVDEYLESLEDGLMAMGIFEFTEDGKLKMQLNQDAWNYFDNSLARRPVSFKPGMYSIMEKIEY